MRDFVPYLKLIRGELMRTLRISLLLACIAAFASVGLTGLAGWFITISAIVGVTASTTFSFLFPSAGVQAFALSRTFSRYGERVFSHQTTFDWLAHLRTALFTKIVRLPAQRLAAYRSGEILSRVMADIDTLDQIILRVIIPSISLLLLSIVCVLFIALFSIPLALITLVMLIINGVMLPTIALQLGKAPGARFVETRAATRTQFIEAIQGRREILSYRAEGIVQRILTQAVDQSNKEQRTMRHLTATGAAVNTLLSNVTLLAVLLAGLYFISRNTMTGPNVAMICLIIMGLFEAIEAIPLAYQFLGQTRKAAQRLNTLTADDEEATMPQSDSPFPDKRAIELRNVSFHYHSQTHDVLHEMNYAIPQGSFITITGRSGIGKSTLLKLLSREIKPEQGQILIGDTELAAIDPADFYRHVTLVSQDSHIFNMSIRDNLLMAKPHAEQWELQRVLEIVRLNTLVSGLEDGLDTKIGEFGYTLSGGEHRRLTIARALLKAPDILLLDEPTSGVDRKTADEMMAAIRNLLPESTILVVTHDLVLTTSSENQLRLSAVEPGTQIA
jgi:ATP-binding cassette subfamily C protein CydC